MEIFLSYTLFIYMFSQVVLTILAILALFGAFTILRGWDFNSTSKKQYILEKRAYLVALIILFLSICKIILFPYFIYVIDTLSTIISGAMCGAGVINANIYGNQLLVVKVASLFLMGIWLIVNRRDLESRNYIYLKRKLLLYYVVFIFLILEIILDSLYLFNISLYSGVECCLSIFGVVDSSSLPLGLTTTSLLAIFYLLYILNTILASGKSSFFLSISSIAFLYFAYFSIEYFFGLYIYQLPTHVCPFCMFGKEYFYIGYFLWGLLLLGVFFGLTNYVLKTIFGFELDKLYKLSLIFNTTFVILVTLYPIIYYINNGVWL